ncbi:putative oxidoreductase [Nocardioides scoriae]|uniref:Putative oxidoreductase n=1 Tax=Nocardioides scoriae TaxID=642780 RepID=A0A1H1VBV5_9ACTN|nr:DoxX family protein [Nocardioides scoriae]SDS81961.1 putative oxidoreductase [Nocardioides scoriae]
MASRSLLGQRLSTPARDLALLLARVGLGVVLVAHGWQKATTGFAATADGFGSMGIPLPEAAAGFAIGVELVGGVLLVLGLLTPVVGVLVLANMAGAWWFAHRDAGLFVTEGGGELVLVIGVLGLALAAVGAGRISLDHALLRRRA